MAANDASKREMFEHYALDRRAARIPNFRLEMLDDLTRYDPTGSDDEAILCFARLQPADAERRIGEELDRLRAHSWAAEWKVHEFDEPPDLKQRLEARGLACHHVEALMVLPVGDAPVRSTSRGDATVEQASGSTLDEMAALQEEIWQCRLPWLAPGLREMTHPERGTGLAFCARVGGRIVGTGWIDFLGGSPFAQLSGGSVHAEFRGRGIYSMMFERRVEAARARGIPYLAVDAAPMSRPILERKGFRYICDTYPMRTRPFDTSAVTRS